MFKYLIMVLLAYISFISFNLGMDWINFYHGIHPAIAFPLAIIAFIGMLVTPKILD